MKQAIFYAPNVHTGGGLVLLQALLASWDASFPLRAFLDERARSLVSVSPAIQVQWVAPRIASRFAAQQQLRQEARSTSTVVCFNGLPPLFSLKGQVVVFLQNRLYISPPNYAKYGIKIAARLAFERLAFYAFRRRVHRYIVQTPSMAKALISWFGSEKPPLLDIVPFGSPGTKPAQLQQNEEVVEWDFLYVADGLPHKNHDKLIDAWRLLAKQGLNPRLAFTLPPTSRSLLEKIDLLRNEQGVEIVNLGYLTHSDMQVVYRKARALIYPSLVESFGLPLVEASQQGLPIVAGELDYVRDVCQPAQTFDPTSEVSIARAVQRFLQVPREPESVVGPTVFWQTALGKRSVHP